MVITKTYLLMYCFSSESHAPKLHHFKITVIKVHFSIIPLAKFEGCYKKIKTLVYLLYCKKVIEENIYTSHRGLIVRT